MVRTAATKHAVALLLWQRVVSFESHQIEVGVFKGNKQCALVVAAY